MAAGTENWDLVANLFINPKNIDELEKQFSGSLSKATKKWLDREVRGPVAKALSSGLAKGLREGLSGGDINKFVTSQIGDMQQEIERLLRHSFNAQKAGHDAHAQQLQQQAQALTRKLQQQAEGWQREQAIYQRAFEDMQADQIKTAKTVAAEWERGANKAGTVMASALRGDMGSILGSIFGEMRGAAKSQIDRGMGMMGQAQKGGPGASGLMAQGKGMAAGGARLNAAVKALEMIYELGKAFIALDERIVDMNRTLIDGFGIADMGLTRAQYGAGELSERIEELRDATTGMNEQFERFGMTYQQQQQVLATLNRQGLTYDKMAKGAKNAQDRMAEYGETMNRVAVYARTLGTDVGEMAGKFAEFSIQTGFDDKQIAEGFAAITQEAQAAGFATKRFYAAVTEAAAEMALWGFRIEETSQLMGQMGKMIGQKFGQDLAATVQKSFQQDTIANLRDILLRDQEFVAEELGKEFELQMGMLERQVGKTVPNIRDIVTQASSEGQLGALLETLPGLTGQMEEQVQRAFRAREAAQGGNLAMMEQSLREAGPGMAAIMRMRTAAPVREFGGDIGQAIRQAQAEGNIAAVKAIKDLSGLDETGFEELRRVAVQSHDTLEAISKYGIENVEEAEKLGLFMKDGVLMRGTIAIDPDTQVQTIDKDNAIEVKNSNDILRGMLQDDDDLQRSMKSDRQVAEEMAKNTKKISEAIDQVMVGVMNDMYDELKFIADMMQDLLGEFTDARRSTKQAGAKAGQQVGEVVKAQKALVEAEKTGDAKKIADAQAKLAKAQEDLVKGEATLATSEGVRGGEFFAETMEKAGALPGVVGGKRGAKAAGQELGKIFGQEERGLAGYTPTGALLGWGHGWIERAAAGVGADPLVARAMMKAGEMDPQTLEALGGESGLRKLAEKAAAQVREEGLRGYDAEQRMNELMVKLGAAAFKQGGPMTGSLSDQLSVQDKVDLWVSENLGGIESNLPDWLRADDLIIPSGGRPIMVNDQDDIMAYKPGGPIAQALAGGEGGKRGNFNVNVWGGNQQEVYATVMKALKAAGFA